MNIKYCRKRILTHLGIFMSDFLSPHDMLQGCPAAGEPLRSSGAAARFFGKIAP